MTVTHARTLESIGNSPLAMVVSNPHRPDNPLEIVNPAFCALTGYREAEVLGRNCRFLSRPGGDEAERGKMRQAIAEQRPVLAELTNFRSDGSPFRNGVMITPLFGDDGKIAYFLGSQVDLGDAMELPRRCGRAAQLVSALPPRQRQVLELVSRGLLNKQIAYELKISEKTVKMHRALMMERLGAATAADAIRIGIEAGL